MAASTFNDHTWQKVGENSRKSADSKPPTQPPIKCPECGSSRIWKDGLRYARSENGGEVAIQRYICRNCGRRFSEDTAHGSRTGFNPTSQEETHSSKSYLHPNRHVFNLSRGPSTCQVCATESVAKNLSRQRTRIKKRAAGATKLSKADIKGRLVDFLWWMKKQGYRKSTIKGRVKFLKTLVNRGANLLDPESVKETLALQESWKAGYKANLVDAYSCFLQMEGLTWKPPIYGRYHKLPFIPLESEIDQLIAGCGKKVSIFIQGLKETAADPGELLAITWTDINKQSRTLTLNHPVKGHNARILPISKHLIARLELLPKQSKQIFPMTYDSMASNYWGQRKRLARNFKNPRLLKTTFTTLRHWKATTLYHKTRDILKVKQFLGHKTLSSTMIYIDIEKAIYGQMTEEFTVRVAEKPEEIKKLLEAGFEYVCEKDKLMFFRKRD